jgi:hypothetical protein
MPTIQTHEICAEGITPHLVHVLSQAFGVALGTVRAWRQPKESDTNPTGTGKRNPLDQVERYIRIIHQYNPGNARQAAEYFIELVNQLDAESGVGGRESGEAESAGDAVLVALREELREAADIPQVLMSADLDEVALRRALREIAEDQAALNRLDAVVRERLKQEAHRAVS